MRHIESRSGCLPDSEQTREWYEQQPISALIRARETAKVMLSKHVQAARKMPGDGPSRHWAGWASISSGAVVGDEIVMLQSRPYVDGGAR